MQLDRTGAPRPDPVVPGPGQESVWDYPRPPRVEAVPERLRVVVAGEVLAETTRGLRVLETAGAPVYYFPPSDVRLDRLIGSSHTSFCEWKGSASYVTYDHAGRRIENIGWRYEDPSAGYEAHHGIPRVLRRARRRGLGGRRAGHAPAGSLLRRLGDLPDRRADQGRARLGRLVMREAGTSIR